MNAHNFIHEIFILSFLSIVHSYIKSTILNTCMQTYALVLIETYIFTHVYNKNEDKLSTSYCTFPEVLSTKTASDCSLTYFRLFQKLSCSRPTWLNKMKSTKITFQCSFIAQNPFQTILGLRKILAFFSQEFENFVCLDPHTAYVKKSKVNKKSLLSAFL